VMTNNTFGPTMVHGSPALVAALFFARADASGILSQQCVGRFCASTRGLIPIIETIERRFANRKSSVNESTADGSRHTGEPGPGRTDVRLL
jgi:hypothetical protein